MQGLTLSHLTTQDPFWQFTNVLLAIKKRSGPLAGAVSKLPSLKEPLPDVFPRSFS
jgi:hypothetical protein